MNQFKKQSNIVHNIIETRGGVGVLGGVVSNASIMPTLLELQLKNKTVRYDMYHFPYGHIKNHDISILF